MKKTITILCVISICAPLTATAFTMKSGAWSISPATHGNDATCFEPVIGRSSTVSARDLESDVRLSAAGSVSNAPGQTISLCKLSKTIHGQKAAFHVKCNHAGITTSNKVTFTLNQNGTEGLVNVIYKQSAHAPIAKAYHIKKIDDHQKDVACFRGLFAEYALPHMREFDYFLTTK